MKKLFNNNNNNEHNFWMSYTDLMSGFLVVFIIISAIAYRNFESKNAELEEKTAQMDSLLVQLGIEEENVSKLNVLLDSIYAERAQLKHVLDSIDQHNLKNLMKEYEPIFRNAAEGTSIDVHFDQDRGSIVLGRKYNPQNPDASLFVFANHEPTPELKTFLTKIRIPLINKTMDIWKERDLHDVELRIEGHTDAEFQHKFNNTTAGFMYNLNLSSSRANSVYRYLLNSGLNYEQLSFAEKNMISVGYSYSKLLQQGKATISNNQQMNAEARHIEFRIISK